MHPGGVTGDYIRPSMKSFIVLNLFLYAVNTPTSVPCTPYSHSLFSILLWVYCPSFAQGQTVTQRERGYPETLALLREKPSPKILSEYRTHACLSPQDSLSSAK